MLRSVYHQRREIDEARNCDVLSKATGMNWFLFICVAMVFHGVGILDRLRRQRKQLKQIHETTTTDGLIHGLIQRQ